MHFFRLLLVIWHGDICSRRGGIFNYDFVANLLLSLIVKNFEIGQHLVKLWARVLCLVFFRLAVYMYSVSPKVIRRLFGESVKFAICYRFTFIFFRVQVIRRPSVDIVKIFPTCYTVYRRSINRLCVIACRISKLKDLSRQSRREAAIPRKRCKLQSS